MIHVRRAAERGSADHGWLKATHTFSFADYYDPSHMGFRGLRVMNEDRIEGGTGFGTHPHRDMEIITFMIEGELEHKDSMGTGSVIKPGDIQYMSAGKGVLHSEFNHSKTEKAHLYQLWILPNVKSAAPRYDQKFFSRENKFEKLCTLVSPNGENGSIAIRADAKLFASIVPKNTEQKYPCGEGRGLWLQVVRGQVEVQGKETLNVSDGLSLVDEKELRWKGLAPESEVLLFDLA